MKSFKVLVILITALALLVSVAIVVGLRAIKHPEAITYSKDSVSVRDFGCVGDGKTDDTHCIQSAIDHAYKHRVKVFVPAGVYLIHDINTSENGTK